MRILLADPQARVRFALRVLLERQPEFEVVAEAANGEDLLTKVRAYCPDLVLLDWDLPHPARLELLSALRQVCPHLCVVALSGRLEARRAALVSGVDAFVSKSDPPEWLLAAIKDCRQHLKPCKANACP
jgi:two-component system nitrate/nitrite response regulator NarL